MHTNVILTNKRRTQAQSNCTNTKQEAWFRRLLYAIRPGNGVGLFYTHGPTRGWGSKEVNLLMHKTNENA